MKRGISLQIQITSLRSKIPSDFRKWSRQDES